MKIFLKFDWISPNEWIGKCKTSFERVMRIIKKVLRMNYLRVWIGGKKMKNSKIIGLFLLVGVAQAVNAESITLSSLANSVQAATFTIVINCEDYGGCMNQPFVDDPDDSPPNYSSHASVSPVTGSGYDSVYDRYYTYSGAAKAYADIASGKVGVQTTSLSMPHYSGHGGIGGDAQAYINDYVQLHIPAASETTVTTIPFKIAIDGSFLDDGGPSDTPGGGVALNFNVAPVDYSGMPSQQYYKYIDSYVTEFYSVPACEGCGWSFIVGSNLEISEYVSLNGSLLSYEPISDGKYDLIGSFEVYGADPIFQLSLGMEAHGNVDFYHTAGFSFDLPQNVTFQSASGVFLTAAAVPEPDTYALMLVGLGLIGFCTRRKAA